MIESISSTRSVIEHLIEACKDGQAGFLAASEGIEDPDLKTLLAGFSPALGLCR